jgi:hypothetical protein
VTTFDEERIAALLRMLPPAPRGWVRAAQELPVARSELDGIVERARRDAEYRAAILADLEAAVAAAGVAPHADVLEHVRRPLQA